MDHPRTYFFVQYKTFGVYLVTMRDSGRVLNSICVDTREQQCWIYNSSEPYEMRLGSQALHLCVGDNSIYEGMQALYEVVRFYTV